MRVLVFGAGAIGSVVGGMLARAGHDVVLIGRAPHVAAVRRKGLHITGIWGEHTVANLACYTSIDEMPGGAAAGVFDLILVTVKSYDTPEAARTVKPLVRRGTLVLSLQNGCGNVETLEEIIGEEEVLIGSRLRLVELDRLLEIAGAFTLAGIPAKPTQKISEHLWGKLLYNAALNPLGAILRRTYGELAENPYTREIMDCVISEIFAAAGAAGVELLWKEPEEFRTIFYEKLVPPTAAHYPSMMRDIELGRRTEIDALNGAVVRLARDAGVIAPVNLALTDQVKFLEDPTGEHHWTY